VLAVQVYPSNTRPHYLERLGPDAGVFIRVGSTNRRAEALEIEELKRWNRMDSFDEQAVPDLNSEAIDFRAASEFFAPYRQLPSRAWSICASPRNTKAVRCRRLAGFFFSVKDRFARFPDAWIQAGRFAGGNRARLLDSVEIRSFLPRAADEAIACCAQTPDSGVDHRGRPPGGSLVGSSGRDPGGAHERHRSCRLRPARSAHPARSV